MSVNYPRSTWAVLYLGSSEIEFANYPGIKGYHWFSKVESNFQILLDFFDTINQPNIKFTSIEDLKAKPEGTYSLALTVSLDSLLDYWENYLLFECEECRNQVHVCCCHVNPKKNCLKGHSKEWPASCYICNGSVSSAHYLFCNFYDAQNKFITVRFSAATINLFFSKFPCNLIVSEPTVYADFLNTLRWHVDRSRVEQGFVQNIVVKKQSKGSIFEYIFVSGVLSPILDDCG